jgi:hypothetical protein
MSLPGSRSSATKLPSESCARVGRRLSVRCRGDGERPEDMSGLRMRRGEPSGRVQSCRSMTATTTSPIETDQAGREASDARLRGRYLDDFEVGAAYKHWPAKTGHRGRRSRRLPVDHEPPPAGHQRRLRSRVAAGPERGRRAARLLAGARNTRGGRHRQGDRQPRHRGPVAPRAGVPTATRISPSSRCSR